MTRTVSGIGSSEDGDEHVERARAFVPRIEAAADEIEPECRIPEPLVTARLDAGLFTLLLPRSLGGFEVDPITFVRITEEPDTAFL